MSAAPRISSMNDLPQGVLAWGASVGTLLSWAPSQAPLVDFPSNPTGAPIEARALVQVEAVGPGPHEVLLAFADGDLSRPIVVGVLRPASAPAAVEVALPGVAKGAAKEALIDGRRVVLEAQDELVLRCGESSITLRRNGRVVIRGAYVETSARGVNRVKGGSVKIN